MKIANKVQSASEIVTPKTDLVFRKLFGTEENKDILCSFLSAVLKMPAEEFEELTIKDPAQLPDHIGGKLCIMDVKVTTTSGHVINIEMQRAFSSDMRKRIIYYSGPLISEQLKAGDDYSAMNRVICIVIADFNILPESKKYFSHFRVCETEERYELSDVIEYNILELEKLTEESDSSRLWDWMNFLKIEERADMDKIRPDFPELQKAKEELEKICQSPDERAAYSSRAWFLRDYISNTLTNYREGYEEGRRDMIKTALALGQSPEDIAKVLGLSTEEVLQIKQAI